MAENSKGGLLNKAEKLLRRRKTQVLQSLGKQGKTTDEILGEDCNRLEKQQEVANKFQRELKHYIHSARALSVASKSFYATVAEAYEPEWENHAQITEILTNMDMLWQDYLQKLQEQVQEPLTKYLSIIPQIKARVAKRGRKLIDYDNAKHNLDVHQNAKKKDDAKISKAQEDLDQAKKIYEDLNNELHQELPEFYNSRVTFYGNLFQSLFSAEQVFQSESGQGSGTIRLSAEKLAGDHEHYTYTPRKTVRSTVSGDDSMTNGHHENGPDSPLPETSSSCGSPTTPVPVSTTEPTTNDTNEADTSKDSIDDEESYENTEFFDNKPDEQKTEGVANRQSEQVTVNEAEVRVSAEVSGDKVEPEIKAESEVKVKAEPKDETDGKKDEETSEDRVEDDKQKEEKEVKMNGDIDSSSEHEVSPEAPPPVPASPPPTEDNEVKENNAESDSEGDDGLYQVPPPAVPVDNDLPPNYQYTENNNNEEDEQLPPKYRFTVVATHSYKGEDDDELSFEAQEIIYVIQYEDPDEQDPGWLMGVRKIGRQTGVFPENFTKKV